LTRAVPSGLMLAADGSTGLLFEPSAPISVVIPLQWL